MTIKPDDIKHIGNLSCIKLEEDVQNTAQELSGILRWVDILKNIDTTGVEPIVNLTSGSLYQHADIAEHDISTESILKNAPKSRYNYFITPKVIE